VQRLFSDPSDCHLGKRRNCLANHNRHGTLSLYAALNTRTGEIVGNAVPRHTSDEFVTFLQSVVATQPRGRAIHVIVDNLSAHKTQKVRTFLAAHSTVRLHYTPTYSSWLNQVELWFSKIERDVIARVWGALIRSV
jgi:transposase